MATVTVQPEIFKPRLMSVKIVNRIIYLNGEPTLNYILPLSNDWRINDLTCELIRACAIYDIIVAWHDAKFLASKLLKEVLRDKRQSSGGFELGWD